MRTKQGQQNFANLECPYCGYIMEVEIPQKGCLVFWKCQKCQKLITTPKGECCVICAYSDKKCPVHKK